MTYNSQLLPQISIPQRQVPKSTGGGAECEDQSEEGGEEDDIGPQGTDRENGGKQG